MLPGQLANRKKAGKALIRVGRLDKFPLDLRMHTVLKWTRQVWKKAGRGLKHIDRWSMLSSEQTTSVCRLRTSARINETSHSTSHHVWSFYFYFIFIFFFTKDRRQCIWRHGRKAPYSPQPESGLRASSKKESWRNRPKLITESGKGNKRERTVGKADPKKICLLFFLRNISRVNRRKVMKVVSTKAGLSSIEGR